MNDKETTMNKPKTITIDDVEYVRADAATPPKGPRCVVVVDRGWIFAGNVEDVAGRIRITQAVHVFRWDRIGFNGVLENPKAEGVDIRKLAHDVDLPASAEVFRVPVSDRWGL